MGWLDVAVVVVGFVTKSDEWNSNPRELHACVIERCSVGCTYIMMSRVVIHS